MSRNPFSIPCDSNRSFSIGCGAAGVWPACSRRRCRDGPVGEAWILSDRDDHQSRVADGPLKGGQSLNFWSSSQNR